MVGVDKVWGWIFSDIALVALCWILWIELESGVGGVKTRLSPCHVLVLC